MRFDVSGTQARPAWLPLFVMSHNNLYPRVVSDDSGLSVTVMTTTHLPWSSITQVRDGGAWFGYSLGVVSKGWEYLLHFRTEDERTRLRAHLRERGVPGA